MSLDSTIKTSEKVVNKDRKFGSNKQYYPVYIIDDAGEEVPALFTENQLRVAIARAEKNMEDMPEETGWLDWLFG